MERKGQDIASSMKGVFAGTSLRFLPSQEDVVYDSYVVFVFDGCNVS